MVVGHRLLEGMAVVVRVAVSVDWQHVGGLVAAETGRRRRRGGLAEGERGARAAQGESGAPGQGASVFRGSRQDDWLAALLLEERCGGGLQNEFGALNALVLVTLRESSRKQEREDNTGGNVKVRETDKVPEVKDGNRKQE